MLCNVLSYAIARMFSHGQSNYLWDKHRVCGGNLPFFFLFLLTVTRHANVSKGLLGSDRGNGGSVSEWTIAFKCPFGAQISPVYYIGKGTAFHHLKY